MKVIVINGGSSSLKFDLVEVSGGGEPRTHRLAHGIVDRIGLEKPTVEFQAGEELGGVQAASIKDHGEAVKAVLSWLNDTPGAGGAKLGESIQAAGHRVVHGGSRFIEPTVLDDQVIDALDGLSELAPLHNPPAIFGIRAARDVLGPSVPMVAVFDTAFHTTMPDYAFTYAIPQGLAEKYGIRRYGFHGVAHSDMLERYSQMAGVPRNEATIITLQLGNGCSACAIKNGRSVDTSMGFTPLEGLVMGTRSGDLDPSIVSYVADKEGVNAGTVESWLNQKSGLLGISGRSSDMRDLLSVMDEDPLARLAIEVFCYRVRKYIGAYLAALQGAQALVFGGGIGEHAAAIRSRICDGLEWAGLSLDPERNSAMTKSEGRISSDASRIAAYVIAVDELMRIALLTADKLENAEQIK